MRIYACSLAILAIFLFSSLSVSCIKSTISSVDVISAEWQEFKVAHGKTYKSPTEELHRFGIYLKNRAKIAKHNHEHALGLQTFRKTINKFSDLQLHEIPMGLKMANKNNSINTPSEQLFDDELIDESKLPKQVDWRKKGAVTEVKDQGDCGSCWAFSSTGSLEGAHFLKTKKLVSLSEQNLLDCSINNSGCNGGLMVSAFKYIIKNKGIDTESSYPYKMSQQPQCKFSQKNVGATMTKFHNIKSGSEKALMKAVATVGPISVAIDATDNMQAYQSGVLVDKICSPVELDHGVLLVGYGTDSKYGDYWIVKNSWGKNWGENGYVRMARNKNNMCGIATMATYPVV